MRRFALSSSFLVMAVLGIWACSSDSDSNPAAPSPDAGQGADASTPAADGATIPEACAPSTVTVPLAKGNLAIVLEHAGSMSDGDRFSRITNAIKSVANDPASTGVSASLTVFNHATDECSAASYTTPDVASTPLPTIAIGAFLDVVSPGGNAASVPALTGVLETSSATATANPDQNTAVVLVTDGDPSGCDGQSNTPEALATVAGSGLPVRTFVLGVDAADAKTHLDAVALAGGTAAADIVTTQQDIVQALDRIRNGLRCALPLPAGFDAARATLALTDGTAITKTVCADASSTGWELDSPSAPTRIVLCAATCAAAIESVRVTQTCP